MSALLLAWREVRRARLRFLLLTGAVGFLTLLIVFQQALLTGLVTEFVGGLRNQDADVLVYGDTARQNVQGSVVPEGAVDAVAALDGVADAGPFGVGTFTIRRGDGGLDDAVVIGHRLDGPGAPADLAGGRRPARDGEVVGSRNDFDVGDEIEVVGAGDQTVRLEVVGVADSISLSVTPSVFGSFETYRRIRVAGNPDARFVPASAVAVAVDDGAAPGEVAARIQGAVDGVEALTRQEAEDRSPGVASVRQSFQIVVVLVYLVVALVTGFFFLILTTQKADSLTLLRALGAPRRPLVGALLVQVAGITLGGLVVGVALSQAALGAGPGIEASIDPGAVIATGVVLLVLALLAATGSVRRVLRIDPVSATTGGAG